MTTETAPVYPGYVSTDSEKRRWDMCSAIARKTFAGEPEGAPVVWQATRSLYESDIPTDEPGEQAA